MSHRLAIASSLLLGTFLLLPITWFIQRLLHTIYLPLSAVSSPFRRHERERLTALVIFPFFLMTLLPAAQHVLEKRRLVTPATLR